MLPYFAFGMFAALALHGRTPRAWQRRTMIAAGVALVVFDATTKALIPAANIDVGAYETITRDLLSGIGFALVVGAVALAPQGRVLGNRVLAGFGTISYGFYLWHVPVLVFLRGHGLLPLDPVLGTLTALVPATAVALLSWVAIERPIIRWAARRNERARAQRRVRQPRVPARAASGGGNGGVDRRAGGREVGTARA